MKSKQLANVLIKVLGLSLLIYGILSFVTGILQLSQISRGLPVPSLMMPLAHGIVQSAIGIYLIVKSQNIAGFLFKNENE